MSLLNADRNSLICPHTYQYTKDGKHSWLPLSVMCHIDSLKCQTLHLFTNMLHCKAPMHRKHPAQFISFLLKHSVWKIKSAVSNGHGFLLMFTMQFHPERTEHGFVEWNDFSALASGLINLFRPVLRVLGSMWFIDQIVCLGSRVLPSPAGSVQPWCSRPAVHNQNVFELTLRPLFLQNSGLTGVWKTLSLPQKLSTHFRALSSTLMPYQAYRT